MFLIFRYPVTIIFLAFFVLSQAINGIDITIITVIIGRNPSFGYEAVAPVYDVAFNEMKDMYPHLFKNATYYTVYKEGTFTCQEGGEIMATEVAPKWIWELVNRHSADFTVVFCAGCSRDVIPLSDFAREWNIPAFASVASNPGLASKRRFPTLTTFPANDDTSLPTSTKRFLDLLGWSTVTLLCDVSKEFPGLNAQYELSFDNVVNKLGEDATAYNALRQTFDSSTHPDLGLLLQSIREYSRVIILFISTHVLREMMIVAYQMNMTNGDYVFVSLQSTTVPDFGNLSWQYYDKDDEVIFDAFQTVIMFLNPDPNWKNLANFVDNYVNTSKWRYNYTFTEDNKLNDFAVSTYETIQAFAMVLNESQFELDTLKKNATLFAKRFWIRNYTFPSRSFQLNSDGIRVNDVNFFRLNVTSGLWQETWHYSSMKDSISVSNLKLSNRWRGNNGPPTDRFLCGFRNELCSKDLSQPAKIAAIAASMIGILLLCAAGFGYWKKSQMNDMNSVWWLLDFNLLKEPSRKNLMESKHSRSDGNNGKQYDGKAVWSNSFPSTITAEQLVSNKAIQRIFFTVRSMHHENLSRFFGILPDYGSNRTSFLFEYGSRGTLRNLLENESFLLDLPLQSSVIWDILSIGDYASTQLLLILIKQNTSTSTNRSLLWRAPEMLATEKMVPTREADVYSFGVVMAEVMTRKSPVNASLDQETHVQSCIKLLKIQSEPRIDFSIPEAVHLEIVIKSCMKLPPNNRLSLKLLKTKLTHVLPRQDIIKSLTSRLQRYSEDLEDIVVHRTHELLAEAKKVDMLLAEMIPPAFIQKLRNKEVVAAENFESVTVLFSDFPQFGAIAASSSPLQLISLLNHVYTTFDEILVHFDAYKVETVNDSYLVASGLPLRNENRHAAEIASLAMSMQAETKRMATRTNLANPLLLRVGFHTGSCAAGVVGVRMPRYCLFGDTINTASRMESYGEVTKVHISLASKLLLDASISPRFLVESRGEISVKGKGNMKTFWLTGVKAF